MPTPSLRLYLHELKPQQKPQNPSTLRCSNLKTWQARRGCKERAAYSLPSHVLTDVAGPGKVRKTCSLWQLGFGLGVGCQSKVLQRVIFIFITRVALALQRWILKLNPAKVRRTRRNLFNLQKKV